MPKFSKSPLVISIVASSVITVVLFVALVLSGPLLQSLVRRASVQPDSAASTTVQVPRVISQDDAVTMEVVQRTQPAVVAVLVSATTTRMSLVPDVINIDPFSPFSPFEAVPQPKAQKPEHIRIGGGSGFFVTADGLIVTNKHVVEVAGLGEGESPDFSVLTNDGKTYPATLVAKDPSLDLAFLKITGSGFPTLTLGDSSYLSPGQTVIAIGNALDEFRNTVTKGVVSGLNRRLVAGDDFGSEVIEEAIQTDAAINPGNSGGPLLDLAGEVVGVNSAVSGQGQSLGFALPVNTVKRDVDQIAKFGRIVRPYVGVRYVLITEDLIKENHLTVDHGALIQRGDLKTDLAVIPGSPADKAGIKENDIVLEVDGVQVTEDASLSSLIGRHAVGDTVVLRVYHAGNEKTVSVTLEELKP